jgi:hypothetical protein
MIPSDSIIRRLLKLRPSQRTDEALYYILAPHLLGFWTFVKPKHAGEEFGDVIFAFGDTCFIFEAKTRELPEKTSESWIRSKIKEAAAQITTNYGKLSTGQIPHLRNSWRGEVKWDSSGIKHYFGIIVLMHSSEPYDPRDISSEIFEKSPIPLQAISLKDMGELMRLMNTPWDFVIYWEFRHSLGMSHKLPVHEENRIYATILTNWIELARNQGIVENDTDLIEHQQFLKSYTQTVMNEGEVDELTKKAIADSYLLDIAAGSVVKKAEKDASGKRVGSEIHDFLVNSVEQIVAIDRRRRAMYGRLWVECASKCISSQDYSWVSAYSPSRDISYILNARPGVALDQTLLIDKMKKQMAIDGTSCVLGLSATAVNIFATREDILATIKGSNKAELEDDLVLNPTAAFIERV